MAAAPLPDAEVLRTWRALRMRGSPADALKPGPLRRALEATSRAMTARARQRAARQPFDAKRAQANDFD
ncbi:hypothetical protein V4889_07145 [Ralstonia solanacearum species complex bacterium KE101]|uniref:hypothetical protein n=1 Tax=Ralstonia solanacearum species complex TaxID=3116862 RepID=UPI00083D774E|nr:hypothetical protein [Ralstonia pseudosolanacearum]AOE89681.1 hypothetical protein LBM341_01393 [Ralstonia solanacearum]AXW57403.1 hypothetical protein CJO93_08275 [Ralstonia solanacearum]NKA02948.1 hypothetical protein [Ralstonia solanacearum]NKA11961.1 hypothetical protein [Ralstonia solanacearum]NKA47095.1 hypothetical protein [Ralstonia solanacearum]